MPFFQYKAMDRDGRLINGSSDALSQEDLELRLKKSGLDLIRAKTVSDLKITLSNRSISRRDLINFYIYMEQILQVGIPVIEGLMDYRDNSEEPKMKSLVGQIVDQIENGVTLSDAMTKFPALFNQVTVSLVKGGEESGELVTIFRELKESLMWQDELISQTKKLLMYPIFVGIVVFGVVCFLMIYLVPQMIEFITSMGHEIPLHTKLLIAVSDFFVGYWYLVLITPFISLILSKWWLKRSRSARYWFDEHKLQIPWFGIILQKILLARFTNSFALLYNAGISILECLSITEGITGNVYIASELTFIREQIGDGKPISEAFTGSRLFPQLVLRMILVGEKTGRLGDALRNVSYFFNRDIKDSIDKAQSMIEPTMTVVLGLILGWVMLSVLGPIYDLVSQIKV